MYCQITNCFRQATAKRGFLNVCEVHLHHTKFCKCKKCHGEVYTGSVFIKKDTRPASKEDDKL